MSAFPFDPSTIAQGVFVPLGMCGYPVFRTEGEVVSGKIFAALTEEVMQPQKGWFLNFKLIIKFI